MHFRRKLLKCFLFCGFYGNRTRYVANLSMFIYPFQTYNKYNKTRREAKMMTTVRERLLTIRLTEMINTYPEYADRLGISIDEDKDLNESGKKEEKENEVQ